MSVTSVVIVTYNGEHWIRRSLESLRTSTVKPHVIVVDNASTDNTVRIIESEFPEVELIKTFANSGFGIGNNIGISRTLELGAEFVLLLNQDAYVSETTVAELADFLNQHDSYGLATPLHCSPDFNSVDRKTQRGYLQTYAQQFLSDACIGNIKRYYKIRGINAAAWFVRTSVFREIGGFDPLFFMYGEDDDMINRLEYHDIKFALVPQSRIVHLRETNTIPHKSFLNDVFKKATRERSALLVEIKHPTCSSAHLLLCLLVKGVIAPLETFLMKRDIKDLLGSFVACVQLVCELRRIRRHARLCAMPGPHFL